MHHLFERLSKHAIRSKPQREADDDLLSAQDVEGLSCLGLAVGQTLPQGRPVHGC